MKKLLILAFMTILLLSTGCIESIHSLVTDDTAYTNSDLEGTWTSSDISSTSLFDNGTLYIEDNVADPDSSVLGSIIKLNEKEKKQDHNILDLMTKIQEQFNKSDYITGFAISSFKIERAHILYFDRPGVSSYKLANGWKAKQIDGAETLHGFPLSTYKDSSHIILKDKTELPYYVMHEYNRGHDFGGSIFEDIRQTKTVSFTKIGSNLFMDVSNRVSGVQTNLVGHTFYKVEVEGDNLLLFKFDQEYLKYQLNSKKIRIKHEKTFGSNIVITASTKEMRSFLEKYGNDEKLFLEAEILKRIPENNIFQLMSGI